MNHATRSSESAAADLDVAVVHGTALERGGGVQVAEELARTFDAPLYFGFCDPAVLEQTPEAVECRVLFDGSPFDRFRRRGMVRNVYYMSAFQHVPALHGYDVVIQSDAETEWYVPPEAQALVRYVHSLPDRAYQGVPDLGDSLVDRWVGFASRILRSPNRHYPDARLANSELTRRQLSRYLDVDAEVAYPPVDVDAYGPGERRDFYLALSRLVEGKGIREVVRTFTEVLDDRRLVVAGSGPLEADLRAAAGPNVTVRGWVDEAEKRRLLGACRAVVQHSGNESFGIVPVEAFASGTPVIALDGGYTPYQVRDGWNGLLYDPGGLSGAVRAFEADGVEASAEEIESFADRYGTDAFRQTVQRAVATAVEATQPSAP